MIRDPSLRKLSISLTITAAVLDRLDEYKLRSGLSRSEIIESAVINELDKVESYEEEERKHG